MYWAPASEWYQKGIRWMRVCHGLSTVFDDPNLVSCAGLAPVWQLAERAGLGRLVAEHVRLGKPGGVNAELKVASVVAGMVAGADSIEDMALLRHGAMSRLFTGVRAPSTLGTFLRSFTFGHVRQLDAVASRLLVALAAQVPLLAGADELAYLDVDDTLRQTYGYAKAGASRGYTGVKGLNALLAVVSTPSSAPVVAAARLRKGSTNSARGAPRFVADAFLTAKRAGATGVLVLRANSAYYNHDVIAAATRPGSRSPPARTGRSGRRSPASPRTPGPRSSTPTRSSTRRSSAGSATRRSPRSATPRSPASPRPAASPPG